MIYDLGPVGYRFKNLYLVSVKQSCRRTRKYRMRKIKHAL